MQLNHQQQRILQTIISHLESNMSKDKTQSGQSEPTVAQQIPTTGSGFPKKRRVLSTPLQAMARIEQALEGLADKERSIVYQWFLAAYGPKEQSPFAKSPTGQC